MKLTITLKQHGHKDKVVETPIADVSLDVLKKLWEAEVLLNSLPGANLRIHVGIE